MSKNEGEVAEGKGKGRAEDAEEVVAEDVDDVASGYA
jgi:hypothetical protein